MELKKELNRFWKWAGITPIEYEKGITPKNPLIYLSGEWECEYPNFSDLETEFNKAIKTYNLTMNESLLVKILEAIAIDHEAERFMDFCKLSLAHKKSFIELGVKFHLSNTRWQMAELLSNIDIPHKDKYLKQMALKDVDSYVRQRALNSLQKIKSLYLIESCLQNLTSKNETLRMISLRHLKSINYEDLEEIKKQLSNDTSLLVRQELMK